MGIEVEQLLGGMIQADEQKRSSSEEVKLEIQKIIGMLKA
jgi:hypothetical protein